MNNALSTEQLIAEQSSHKLSEKKALDAGKFRRSLDNEYKEFLKKEALRFDHKDCLRIDLHCHDYNSDIPDELWGRILRLPETWLKTEDLTRLLKNNGCNVVTVTNHNNARSCWELIDQGYDALVAAEFTCYFPEYELYVHVLTYGFTKEQETILNEKRQNVYDFVKYAALHDIPLILPHPLYFYTRNEKIALSLFEKMAVMFERFEVLNGQRDLWQSVLTLNWLQGLTAEKINTYATKHNLNPADFGVDPSKAKVLTGGSDDHTGIFAGQCGSRLYIPNLADRLTKQKPSVLALEAIRNGNISPFGQIGENQKLNIALLDYFSQVATKIKDPGLFRIMLHRGSTWDKIGCFAVSNILLEMQKHKKTMKFFEFIHDAMQGKKPNRLVKWKISKNYRFCIEYLERIADSRNGSPEHFVDTVTASMNELFTFLNKLVAEKVKTAIVNSDSPIFDSLSTAQFTRKFEMPSQLTALFFGDGKKQDNISNVKVEQILNNLSFPVLISLIIAGASLASTRVLYQNRDLLNEFAGYLGKNKHQKRALYLTDTLRDKNGVSNSLSGKLKEIQRADLPVDFLICHPEAEPEQHLHVVRPITTFDIPKYGEQEIRIPDLMQIARIFYEGGYDRIICSTEGPMAVVSLFLKEMFNVPCYFFMHTDWIDFIKCTTKLSQYERDRIRRMLRALYNRYDGIFVLNSEHKAWLTGHEMMLNNKKVFLTAHHTRPVDLTITPVTKSDLFVGATPDTPVLFIACRISREKGLFDLPEIITTAQKNIPDLKIVIAGSGPASEQLQNQLPNALFLGWQSKEQLAALYLGLDLFVFPSRFDTFGNVILEAFSHGMPVIAYNCKGPKDIVEHRKNGLLVENIEQMSSEIINYFNNKSAQAVMQKQAMLRAAQYQAQPIMDDFLRNVGLDLPTDYNSNQCANTINNADIVNLATEDTTSEKETRTIA
jgi:glycosyltransferase involved in cell wall biosynthesis